jgi:hypothetical protein
VAAHKLLVRIQRRGPNVISDVVAAVPPAGRVKFTRQVEESARVTGRFVKEVADQYDPDDGPAQERMALAA